MTETEQPTSLNTSTNGNNSESTLTLSSSSSSSPPSIKSGILFKKSKSFWKSGWKEKHCVLNGSSLYYYEKSTSEAAQGVIQLQNGQLMADVSVEKRKFVIGVQTPDKPWYLAARNETEYEEWVAAITTCVSLPPLAPPEKPHKLKKGKVGSQLVDSATNIQAVRRIIKDYVSDDTFVVMEALKSFVSQYDSPEQAEILEIAALQTGAKVALLYRDKKVSKDYFMAVLSPLHALCDKLIDGYEIPFTFSATELITSMNEVQSVMEKMLKPHLPDRSMKQLNGIFAYFADEGLLNDFFTKKKWKECAEVGLTLRNLWDNGQL